MVRDGIPDDQGGEAQDNQEDHHQTIAGREEQSGGKDESDQRKLFEAITEDKTGLTEITANDTEEKENKVPVDLDEIIIKRRTKKDKHDGKKLFEIITEVPASDDRQDDEAAQVRDGAQAGVCDAQDQNKLFEAVTEVQTANDSPARPKRSVKLTPRCGPDDYSPKTHSLDEDSQDDYKPSDCGQVDYKPIDYGQDDHSPSNYSPDDSDNNCMKRKPRTDTGRRRARARGST